MTLPASQTVPEPGADSTGDANPAPASSETPAAVGGAAVVVSEAPVPETPAAMKGSSGPVDVLMSQKPDAAPAPVVAVPLAEEPPAAQPPRTTRLLSLDALRGFDMFWIIGFENLVQAVASVWPNRWTKFAAYQLDHSKWEGFRFYDLIFPMFVFIVGVSTVFSLRKILETRSKWVAVRRVVVRGVILYLLGVIYYGGLSHGFGDMYRLHGKPVPEHTGSAVLDILMDVRLMGVLQRIAICYLVTGLLFIFLRPKVLAGIAVGLLLLYWGLMNFVAAPGQAHASFEAGKNLANWIDARYLPGYKWGNELGTPDDGRYDPEGLLSTLPAVAGCMLGLFAGLLLRDGKVGQYRKFGILLLSGVVLVGAGYAWGLQFPVIKKVWTSSFVLLTAGYSAVLLSFFYLVIDVWRLRFWVWPFVWIGMNAITLYLVWQAMELVHLPQRMVGGELGHGRFTELSAHVPRGFTELAAPVLGWLLIMALARLLYKRQIFLRV